MSEFSKISYYDLRLAAQNKRLPEIIGRFDEMQRLTRVISRRIHNNCLVVGPGGIGKTVLVHAWIKQLNLNPEYSRSALIQIEAEDLYTLGGPTVLIQRYLEAFNGLPSCVLFIDNFGSLVQNKPIVFQNLSRLLKVALERLDAQVVLTMEPHEYKWIEAQDSGWLNWFETVNLKNQPMAEQVAILRLMLGKLKSAIKVDDSILETIVEYVQRFGSLGQLPSAAVQVLDESLALAKVQGSKSLNQAMVQRAVSDKTSIPLAQLQTNEVELLKNLQRDMETQVIGQTQPLAKIATIIQRAKLGLRNPNRPLGSFLLLGPSGVGKTETAKVLAGQVFGRKENFVRIDMSEFGQEHTVQRLIGAPPGYVGYDSGGGLTNQVADEPYSLVLLDEIEKAHSKVFDIFLQILDDGRLTSGQGDTVDFTQTIVMATSNLAVPEIIQGFENHEDIHSSEFLRKRIMPKLSQAMRPEFLNRFDSIIIFNPLTLTDLVRIAQLEIAKIEQRVKKFNVKFAIDDKTLARQIAGLADHRFGARPVKRFIEEVCETLITKNLLK